MNAPEADLNGKTILVTGGTGSFGQKFVETILKNFEPARLVIYSRDEFKQYEMAQKFSPADYPCLRYFIGDVRDRERLNRAFNGVDIVVHAAAMKHVPISEYNPSEAIRTNVDGAQNVIDAALDRGVQKVLALSTDKAVNPVNLYGATKLCSDKLFIAANNLSGAEGSIFSVVRYGNVLGSRGSVLPLFQKLLSQGATSLPITDPRMTRFWILLEEGVQFVVRCLQDMQGGETFVPKIPSTTISDLAKALDETVDLETVGIRVGEKLHEVMIVEADAPNTLEYDDRYIIAPSGVPKFEDTVYKVNGQEGTKVPNEFRYSSDQNTEWLSLDGLREKITLAYS